MPKFSDNQMPNFHDQAASQETELSDNHHDQVAGPNAELGNNHHGQYPTV